jgi:RNA polymerase sigma-70 factor (ECF subfamily)
MEILRRLCSPSLHTRLEASRARLYRMAYAWRHDPDLADDLVQETLARALKQRAQLREDSSFDAWLYTIMANCHRDWLRRERHWVDIEEAGLIAEDNPADAADQGSVVSRVRAAVARLPEAQRQVLTLVDLEEMTYAQVAAVLNIPQGTVMSRLFRARAALRAVFDNPAQTAAHPAAASCRLKVVK